MKKHILKYLLAAVFSALTVMLVLFPSVAAEGISHALIVCSDIIIPSLFPFTACVLFLMRCGITRIFKIAEGFSMKVFGQSCDMFTVMLFSFIGGYPVGARLITDLHSQGKISDKDAQLMLCFCVNAGPAFVVSAIGSRLLSSQKAGYILLLSHILPSLLFALILSRFFEKSHAKSSIQKEDERITDVFVNSVSDAAKSVFSICIFILLFSTLNSYIAYFSEKINGLKVLLYITEVTLGCSNTRNIYLISFLLGFSGLCIWCQVASACKGLKFKWGHFALFRILHGSLSSLFTFIFCKLFKLDLPTVSNGTVFSGSAAVSGVKLAVALAIMGILFIISLEGKKRGGKLRDDLV